MIVSTAIVTPTYAPDFDRCALLVESLGLCAPTIPHVLIVDRCDRQLFSVLESQRTTIVESQALLPRAFMRLPGRRSIWLNARGLPVRGWIIQQMLKISAASAIDAETLVYVDSDVAFTRPFDPSCLRVGNSTGLLDIDFRDGKTVDYTAIACALLGIDPTDVDPRGHIGNMICWNRETVFAMQRRIEEVSGISWQQAIARKPTFSEYTLYGVFVRGLVGYPAAMQVPTDLPLIKHSWGTDLSTARAVSNFFVDFDARTVGIMAHSKDPTDLVQLRIELERQWRATGVSS